MAEHFLTNPVPGFHDGDSFDPGDELMYSTNGTTQKGITVAGGQGVITSGTLMARNATDKKYYVYASAGADGAMPSGVLRRSINTDLNSAGDQLANIVIMGIMKLHMITQDGGDAPDNDAIEALGAVLDTARNTWRM